MTLEKFLSDQLKKYIQDKINRLRQERSDVMIDEYVADSVYAQHLERFLKEELE